MYSTPITMAVIESPGMPNTSAGIQAPASAELLAAPASTIPSGWPVPNFSGSLDIFLLIAYYIHSPISPPPPHHPPPQQPPTPPPPATPAPPPPPPPRPPAGGGGVLFVGAPGSQIPLEYI